MEKYRRAMKRAMDNLEYLARRGMRAEGYSQLVGSLNTINYLAANDDAVSPEEYLEFNLEISVARSTAIRKLVNEDENNQ